MLPENLTILDRPALHDARMVLSFTGWMDGGEVSTGAADYLVAAAAAKPVAHIDPEPFYIYNFPGSMEVAALFRPHVRIDDGLIAAHEPPSNVFFASEKENLVLFRGKEPHLRWATFADCIFALADLFAVRTVYFIGTFGGAVPHTREPRIYASVSSPDLKPPLHALGIRFSNYDGPGSFATYLTRRAAQRATPMISLVAEIPVYVVGRNPKCIEAMVRRFAGLLGLQIDLDRLRPVSDAFEERLTEAIKARPDLLKQIARLEEEYDKDIFNTEMGDLRDWLERRGIRLT